MSQEETFAKKDAATPQTQMTPKAKWAVVGFGALALVTLNQLFSPEWAAERMLEDVFRGEYDIDINRGQDGSFEYSGEYQGQSMHVHTGENVSLPEDWPSTIPVAEDAEIKRAIITHDSVMHRTSYVMSYSSHYDVDMLKALYLPILNSSGWVNVTQLEAPGGGSILSATRNEEEVASIYITKTPTVSDVNIIMRIK